MHTIIPLVWRQQNNRKELNPMHWTERRRARVNLALGLQAHGWTLHGFKEDRSDSMTDYYDPASWDGIAEKGGYVVVVDVKPTNETLLKRSGGYETTNRVPGDDCTRCQGTGKEPDGWTYEEALAEPREFNLDRTKRQTPGAVPLMPHIVSPLYFGEAGREKCVRCSGLGHTWKLEQVSVDWPEFSPNPDRALWHVEKGGRILESGIGLGPCADWDREKAQAAVERIVNHIEDAIHRHHDGTADTAIEGDITPSTGSGPCIRRNLARNGIEVVFPAKPGADVRAGMKRLRFRWSRRQGLWYARYSARLWEEVHELLNIPDLSCNQQVSEPDESPNPLLDVPQEPAPMLATPPVRAGPSELTAQIALF
jgi:hypothetical protein